MGRHARGATHPRVPVAVVVWTVVVLLVLGAGAWLGDRGPVSGSQDPVAASAVVVSSLACTNGTGTTLVDVLIRPPPVRPAPFGPTLDGLWVPGGSATVGAVRHRRSGPRRSRRYGAGRRHRSVAARRRDRLPCWRSAQVSPSGSTAGGGQPAPGVARTGRHLVDHETSIPSVDPAPGPGGSSHGFRYRGAGAASCPTGTAGDRVPVLAAAERRRAAVEPELPVLLHPGRQPARRVVHPPQRFRADAVGERRPRLSRGGRCPSAARLGWGACPPPPGPTPSVPAPRARRSVQRIPRADYPVERLRAGQRPAGGARPGPGRRGGRRRRALRRRFPLGTARAAPGLPTCSST